MFKGLMMQKSIWIIKNKFLHLLKKQSNVSLMESIQLFLHSNFHVKIVDKLAQVKHMQLSETALKTIQILISIRQPFVVLQEAFYPDHYR